MELNKEENVCHNRDHATNRVLTLLCCRWDSQLSASGATPRALAKAFCAAADTWCFLFFFPGEHGLKPRIHIRIYKSEIVAFYNDWHNDLYASVHF